MDRDTATRIAITLAQGKIPSQSDIIDLRGMGVDVNNLGTFTDLSPLSGLVDLDKVAEVVGIDLPTQADWESGRANIKPRNRVIGL